MDRVRFGRALGGGAREAAKALLKAADAAAAPNPPTQSRATVATAPRVQQVKQSAEGIRRGSKRFGEAMWGPLAKQSGVLWLEFTGVFFGLFAMTAGLAAWKHRGELMAAGPGHAEAWFAVAMLVVFGYFTVSSFVKAAARGRR